VDRGEEMKRDAPSVKLTYEDFLHFPDDGMRHELIDGEHYVTPSPNTKHQTVSGNLFVLLRVYLKSNPIGAVFAAPFDVVFSNFDVVEPDLLYISRERLDVLTRQHVRGAPDLVVEILSPGTRRTDENTKRRLYERFDVQEYWIVDPERESIQVFRRTGREPFIQAERFSAERENVLTTPLLPDWSAPLTEIFASPI
jgi:Uma2 family endonuclease